MTDAHPLFDSFYRIQDLSQFIYNGSTAKFYEWLEALAPHALPEGPAIWICGDCHLGNLGPVSDPCAECVSLHAEECSTLFTDCTSQCSPAQPLEGGP